MNHDGQYRGICTLHSLAAGAALLVLAGCNAQVREVPLTAASVSFDGAVASADADQIAHGERLADIFACGSCHQLDYTGGNFGALVPLFEGL